VLSSKRLRLTIRDWSLGKKLIAAEALLVLLLLAAFTFYVAKHSAAVLEKSHIDDMKRQVNLAKGILDVYEHTVSQSTEKLTNVFISYFPGRFQLEPGRTVRIGAVDTPALLYDNKVLNLDFETIDRFTKMTGGVATVFARDGDDFVRITTSLKKQDGSRAIGTTLGKGHPAHDDLIKGVSYLGRATLFGRDYSTKYVPIKGSDDKVIGVLFVGFDTSEALNFMKRQINAIKIGKTGYIFAMDAENGEQKGTLVIHPRDEGKNILTAKSTDGREYAREMINTKNGVTRFFWMNTDNSGSTPQEMVAVYTYVDYWKMILAAGAFEDDITADIRQMRNTLIVASILITVIIIGVLFYAARRMVVQPLRQAVEFAGVVAGGDLSKSLEVRNRDEIGFLGEALNKMVSGLKEMIGKVRDTSGQVAGAANQISASSGQLAVAAHSQVSAAEETSSTMGQMASSIQTVAANADSLAGNADAVLSSIQELGASGEQVAKNAEVMATSVAEVSSTIEEMTLSISQMASNNYELQKVVSESAATIEELAVSIKEVANNVVEADKVAKSATKEAGAGEAAIQEALAAMMRVGEVIEKTASSLVSLDRRSEEIGNIVKVIRGIAEQSNLLALNASIQAAQAGEAGQGFAVVAEEMRKLAIESAEATREIGEVISQVQADTTNSVKFGELAAREAKASMELSSAAGNSLANIVKSIEQTSSLMSNIARMTAEQANASNQVIRAVEKMGEASNVLTNSAREQAFGSGQIRNAVEVMNNLTAQVTTATREQSLAAQQILDAVNAMNDMTQHVASATAEQKAGVKVVVSAVDNISDITGENLVSIEQLSQATRSLSQQAIDLAVLIEEFKV
jgi:methyl-accepting chemotaxis protein